MEVKSREHIKEIKTYKPGKPIEEVIRELGLKGEVVKLASNENPLGISPLALKAIKRALKEFYLYPDDNCFYLRKALAQKFSVSEEEIIIGNGSVEILPLVTLAYLNPEENAVISQSAFIWYKIAVNIVGGKLIEVPMKDYTHDLETMAEAITPQTKLVFIANPNNPTGTIVTKEEVERFMNRIPENILVVMDEAYYEYIKDPSFPDSFKYLKEGKNILILRTYSKIYGMAGIRLGYGFTKKEIVSNLMKVRISFNANRISQVAGIAALEDIEHIQKSIVLNEEGKHFLCEAYKKLGLFFLPTFGNFIFVDFNQDSQKIFEGLQREGVITRTIKEYGFPDALRITIGTEEQNKKLIRAIEKILSKK
ncbi:MAG: histidinol-phosphate transaminase [Candidatus Edwardsbacteria bacterium]